MSSQNLNDTFVVTGASGYIGKKVTSELKARGYRVIGIDFRDTDINIDLSRKSLDNNLKIQEPIRLIHLASPLPGNEKAVKLFEIGELINTNIINSLDVVDVLFMSSTAVYSRSPNVQSNLPEVAPWEIYGNMKLAGEVKLSENFQNLTIFRSGTIYDQNRKGGIANLINRLLAKKITPLPNSGKVHHPFVHSSNVIESIVLWAENGTHEERIIDLVPPSIQDLATTIQTLIDSNKHIINISPNVLKLIGSERHPIMGISKWHFGALSYDLPQFLKNSYNKNFKSTSETLKSTN